MAEPGESGADPEAEPAGEAPASELELDYEAAGLDPPGSAPVVERRSHRGPMVWMAAAILASGPAAVVYFVRADSAVPLVAESERAIADPMLVRSGEVRAPHQLEAAIAARHDVAARDAAITGGVCFLLLGLVGGRVRAK